MSEGGQPSPLLFYIHTSESALSCRGLTYKGDESRYSVSSGAAEEGPWLHQPPYKLLLTAWLRASVVNPKEAKHAIREANCENMSSTAPLTDVEEVQQAV